MAAGRGQDALARAHLAAGEAERARHMALAAARTADRHGFRPLAWRCWWTAQEAGAGPHARRRAQAGVADIADALDEPLRERFLAAVPVEP